MFEAMTYEKILEQMLERVDDGFDKREGSVIYDALAPCAAELAQLYIAMDVVIRETFVDTASLYYLKKRCAERGIHQKLATKSTVKMTATPSGVEIAIGSRFSCGEQTYTVCQKVSDGVYYLTCDTAGTDGNKQLGTAVPIDYIAGLETAAFTEIVIPGVDDEDVEKLRERYFNHLQSQAFGGNIADYKEKTVGIDGVGGVKVEPVWNGGGTVKLTIIDSGFRAPSAGLVEKVQSVIDPTKDGQGWGIAPIGHIVTVVGCQNKLVQVSANLTYKTGWGWQTAQSYVEAAIDDYFQSLAERWDETDAITVRISNLTSAILGCCDGILDVGEVSLNGIRSNIVLAPSEIPVRGTVNA